MKRLIWNALDAEARAASLTRPAQVGSAERSAVVARLVAQVRADGDATLRALTRRYDGCELGDLAVSAAEFDAAETRVDPALREAIAQARERIACFHAAAAPAPVRVETAPGVVCERVLRPLGRVGLYAPAGTAPLPSTVLMLAVTAQLAGCPEVVLCTPANAAGECDPVVLYTAKLCGVGRVFKLGGAQAIAAMAYGTASVPRCDKLFGPGNAWVTEAKRQVANDVDGAAIDLPAGPSEVLVIADAAADAAFVAADLLSQAEHGSDSQVMLLSPSRALLDAVAAEVEAQLQTLPRAAFARDALAHSRLIEVANIAEALAISNAYAPEHLILNVVDPRALLPDVRNAGSVFLGAWSPEAVGDYCSGTNHVLPTYGYARAWSGVSVASFVKQITVQELSPDGLRAIGPCARVLADAEQLHAHERAVALRLERLGAGA
ncbi:MAG TPA: histidinol dehydrogenase [Tahibacter sp.]|uniref:histidinol dehydrogenase n=1 Tax=Tahibacter sp. TaxID=2056211 RepID=UPI002C3875D8|nr:histidinol dehydrogenase [Tahibacter sp.]HSX63054.1 histidinol dehydrogenase [Tahibacter sp.]